MSSNRNIEMSKKDLEKKKSTNKKKNNNRQKTPKSQTNINSNASTMKNQKLTAKVSDDFRIRRREFLANLAPSESQELNIVRFDINPGNKSSFPWLSEISPSFQKYRVKNLRLCYKTATSTFSPGMVMIAPIFNVKDKPPETKTSFLEYSLCQRSPVWKDFSVDVYPSSLSYKDYYIRDSSLDTSDSLLYDCMYFIIACDAQIETDYIGEVWLEYDIELIQPRRRDMQVEYDNVFSFTFTAVSNANSLNNPVRGVGGFKVDIVNNNSFRFNEFTEGTLLLVLNYSNLGNHTTAAPTFVTGGSGTVQVPLYVAGEGGGGSGSYAMYMVGLNDFQAGDTLTLVSWGSGALTEGQIADGAYALFGEGLDPFSPPPVLTKFVEKTIFMNHRNVKTFF